MVSTPPTLDSRKKIRIVKTSISETRFMSTIVWLRLLRSLRLSSGVICMAALYCFLIGASPIEMLGK